MFDFQWQRECHAKDMSQTLKFLYVERGSRETFAREWASQLGDHDVNSNVYG